jgi:hypothetical protein
VWGGRFANRKAAASAASSGGGREREVVGYEAEIQQLEQAFTESIATDSMFTTCAVLLSLEAQNDELSAIDADIVESATDTNSVDTAIMDRLWTKVHVIGELVQLYPRHDAQAKTAVSRIGVIVTALGSLEQISNQFDNAILPEIIKLMIHDAGSMEAGLSHFWELCEPVTRLLATTAHEGALMEVSFAESCQHLRDSYAGFVARAADGGDHATTPWNRVFTSFHKLFHNMHEALDQVAAIPDLGTDGGLSWASVKLEGPTHVSGGSPFMSGTPRNLLFLKQLSAMRSVLWACRHYAAA